MHRYLLALLLALSMTACASVRVVVPDGTTVSATAIGQGSVTACPEGKPPEDQSCVVVKGGALSDGVVSLLTLPFRMAGAALGAMGAP